MMVKIDPGVLVGIDTAIETLEEVAATADQ